MLSLLVAYTKNKRVIGAQGKIPWKLSSERNRFKEICRNKFVIMGRKSFEEIGKPLSYCTLVVVTRDSRVKPENDKGVGIITKTSLDAAIDFCKAQGQEEILVAGGATIYEQALPYADKIYATEIDADFDGDTLFPALGPEWTCTVDETHEEDEVNYMYLTYIRTSV